MKTGASYTKDLITDFAFALRAESYIVRLIHADKGQVISEIYKLPVLVKMDTIKFLRARNREGLHVYARPDATQYILVDDLDLAKIAVMHKDGLCTRCVVQTSPGNYQAWVQVAKEPISQEEAKVCAQLLAKRYGGDPGAVSSMQLGRPPGLTNRKHDYIDEHGRYPFTQLHKPSMRAVPHNVINTEVLIEAREMLSTPTPSFTPVGECDLDTGSSKAPSEAMELYREAERWLLDNKPSMVTKPSGEIDRSNLDFHIALHYANGGMSEDDLIEVLSAGSEKAKTRKDGYVHSVIEKVTTS